MAKEKPNHLLSSDAFILSSVSSANCLEEDRDGVLVDNAHNEPTGEKISSSSDDKPPTAASVNVLLRQALHADDRSSQASEFSSANTSIKGCGFSLYGFRGLSVLLLTHSSGIMSRYLSFNCSVGKTESLRIVDDLDEEEDEGAGPVIYEEEREGTEEAIATDEEADASGDEAADGVTDFEDFDYMSD
ncbi:unnamed protein product [Eruca vesicaria subsp. sativa]|uniref:Uncharacterized protein n=1 Tax=Eruca vesicaria subsp. sativa TaxID=29727 RepID=A0ABC8LFS9_ERUVS|nr:unnamed protein product [Eruca vesicaria subsp. sativa]